jgi:nucleoside-diphosphate-sugar epimerase
MFKNILLLGSKGYLGNQLKIRLSKDFRVYEFNRKEIKMFQSEKNDLFKNITFDAFFNLTVKYDNQSSFAEVVKSNYLLALEVLEKIKKSEEFKIFYFDTFYSKFYTKSIQSSYLLSKKNLVEWARLFHLQKKKPTTFILRLEHVVGPDESERKFNGWLINKLKKNEPISLGPCDHSFDFIHIKDIIDSIIILLATEEFKNKFVCLDVGSGKAYPLKNFVNLLKSKLNSKSKITFGTTRLDSFKNQSSVGDIKELIVLGWKPKTDLNEIIDSII